MPKSQPLTSRPKIRVLVADDHKIMRQGLVCILNEEPDMEVVGEACDGQQTVALACDLKPDVVIMDVTMPGVSGVEATRTIRRQLPQTQIVALSVHDPAHKGVAMRDAGAAAYVYKGRPIEDLLAAIREAVAGPKP